MYLTVTLNAKLQPMHRHEIEDIVTDIFKKQNIKAEITGGGTLQGENGEIELCDLEVELDEEKFNDEIIDIIEFVLAPKGSKITIYPVEETGEPKVILFGKQEGLGLYLNNDLDGSVYQECDVNIMYSEINKLLEEQEAGRIESYWEAEETSLYLYGKSFDEMHKIIKPFLDTYPLCENCRIVQIA